MHSTTRRGITRVLAVALLAVTPLVAAACSDDESSSGDDTTTTTVPRDPCSEVYVAGDGEPEGADAVATREAPELTACEPEGSDMLVVDEIVGTGAEVTPGATVTVHYAGVDATTGTEFDSSWSRGQTISFPLDGVIQGWSEGLVGMKEGGRRTLVIPPELGYGDSGPAPGDSLIFTVDLVSVEDAAATTTTVAG